LDCLGYQKERRAVGGRSRESATSFLELWVIVAIITARADLWRLILVLALIPLGDALVVLTNGGRKSAAFGIHGATAAAMIIAALLLERS
jgi:hypothetical protein